jgi:hypothetical protein
MTLVPAEEETDQKWTAKCVLGQWCRGRESNPHTSCDVADFKVVSACASTCRSVSLHLA